CSRTGSASTPSSDTAADDPPPRTEEHGHRMNENPSTDPADTDPAGTDAGDEAALLAEIDAELAAERSSTPRAGQRVTGLVLLIGALIGWIASLELQVGKEFLLSNPGESLACDVNP